MDKPITLSFRRRKLPHWRVAGHPYFVTIRLKSSLPETVVEELKRERDRLRTARATRAQFDMNERCAFRRIEAVLDGVRLREGTLSDPRIAALVLDTFQLVAQRTGWCFPYITVMPNHVHFLASQQDHACCTLEKATGSIKQHTAKEANKLLGRHGAFWEPEMFDYWCRNADAVWRVREYIRNNAVKAGLVMCWQEWAWLRLDDPE